ncbi:MAG: hypothetical protein ENTB_04666 [Enterocloster aldenensis]
MDKEFPQEAQKIMDERFGHDTLIALATLGDNIPNVRTVNAYYLHISLIPNRKTVAGNVINTALAG